MIHITKTAQNYFAKLLEKQEPGNQIRIFIINPKTTSVECQISYCPPDTVEQTDIELKFDKFSAFVDEISAPFLKDAEIDLVTDQLGYQITIKAPNAKISKIADDAPLIERVQYVIQSQINPQLASHGGKILLMEITDDRYVIIQFSGGCNGCSMNNITLKEGIEKHLLNIFPDELKGVKDLTKHQHGDHSFY
ncbi:Fe/S biogenesis protein NfuA [Arsenophonus endosymbiont of Aleurodicus dispersus]|uniref:Fe-S biogenesis protein NfuA n=1 Tax=Arsenophonus endosymbiont of Aleurodicus dispersus TaxID=235559 RepID=UPI000EB596C1|nr:Fe-S biogenesis protein NfuA [Arsenophonus endosymbiont of Aleurodicus dispersus]VAY02162.1 Fe/S biogenesis protein NfuA [Arsenophonus endosymbiont of Aleurodicus dispersus]